MLVFTNHPLGPITGGPYSRLLDMATGLVYDMSIKPVFDHLPDTPFPWNVLHVYNLASTKASDADGIWYVGEEADRLWITLLKLYESQ